MKNKSISVLWFSLLIMLFLVVAYLIADNWNVNLEHSQAIAAFDDIDSELSSHQKVSILNQIENNKYIILAGFLTAFLTFIAFYIQLVANKNARRDVSVERFENRYFEWVGLYRDIVRDMKIEGVGAGKDAFHFMFFEYKQLFYFIEKSDFINRNTGQPLTREQCVKIAFCIFYNGVSGCVNSTVEKSTCMSVLSNQDYNKIIAQIHLIQDSRAEDLTQLFDTDDVKYINDYVGRCIVNDRNMMFFDGHRQRLPEYLKLINIVVEFMLDSKIETHFAKYIKYLSFQMSEHELGLIYCFVNSDFNIYDKETTHIVETKIIDVDNLFYKYNTLHDDFLR